MDDVQNHRSNELRLEAFFWNVGSNYREAIGAKLISSNMQIRESNSEPQNSKKTIRNREKPIFLCP